MARGRLPPQENPLERRIPTPQELRVLCEEYGLGELLAIEEQLGGYFNVNLKVRTTTGRYVVRVMARLTTEEHVLYAHHIISILRENGLPAMLPLLTQTGEAYSCLDGRIVQIHHFASGENFNGDPRQAMSSGRMLRRMHEVLADEPAGPVPVWSNYPSDEVIREGLRRLRNMADGIYTDDVDVAERLYDRVAKQWEPVSADLPTTIIHGDWHPRNQLYDEHGEVVCIMDFDFVQKAERLHDVAYAVSTLLRDRSNIYLGESFLQGYGRLEASERAAFPVAVARASGFFIWTAAFTPQPDEELEVQLSRQSDFIDWALSDEGRRTLVGMTG